MPMETEEMDHPEADTTQLGRVVQRLSADQFGRCFIPLAALVVAGIIIGTREGFGSSQAVGLYGGGIASVIAIFSIRFRWSSLRMATKRSSGTP